MDMQANVPKDIWDLVPGFVRNRQAEVGLLREALSAADIEMLTHLAERMWALGNPYGFRQITTFGRELREAVAARRMEVVGAVITWYAAYLEKVKVVQVEAPVPRSVWRERAAERRAEQDAFPLPGISERRTAQRRKVSLRRPAAASETPAEQPSEP